MGIRCGLLFLVLLISGCATNALHDQDMAKVVSCGTPTVTVAKMQHHLPLELSDIVALAKQKVPDDIVLRYLQFMRSSYTIYPKNVEELRAEGVSDVVINYLLSTPSLYATDRNRQNQIIPATQPNRDPLLNGQPNPRTTY